MKPGFDFIGLSVFALIFNNKNKVLLVNHKPTDKKPEGFSNCWSMPGGTVEFGEACVEALKREIKEELDIEIGDEKLINYNEYILKERHWVALNFSAKTKASPKILEPDKLKDAQFFSLNNLPDDLSAFCQECINIINKEKNV